MKASPRRGWGWNFSSQRLVRSGPLITWIGSDSPITSSSWLAVTTQQEKSRAVLSTVERAVRDDVARALGRGHSAHRLGGMSRRARELAPLGDDHETAGGRAFGGRAGVEHHGRERGLDDRGAGDLSAGAHRLEAQD